MQTLVAQVLVHGVERMVFELGALATYLHGHGEVTYALLWAAGILLTSMPRPKPESSTLYCWCWRTAHLVVGNRLKFWRRTP